MVEPGSLLPAAALMMASILGAAWCVVRGSTIGASSMVEKPEASIWGLVSNAMGALILLFGLVTALILILPESLSLLTVLAGEIGSSIFVMKSGSGVGLLPILLATTIIVAITMFYPQIAGWGTTFIVILVCFVSVMMSGIGGGVGVIPESAWPLLLGTVTMLGAAACAAVCIMVAVRSGSAAMVEKPELSIWSLLFVALGEGLAIYGLIVALLIVMG